MWRTERKNGGEGYVYSPLLHNDHSSRYDAVLEKACKKGGAVVIPTNHRSDIGPPKPPAPLPCLQEPNASRGKRGPKHSVLCGPLAGRCRTDASSLCGRGHITTDNGGHSAAQQLPDTIWAPRLAPPMYPLPPAQEARRSPPVSPPP
jgi:hypothetical protein